MPNVSILRGATAVGASRDSLEMDTTVLVRSTELYIEFPPNSVLLVIADINDCHNVSCGENATCIDEVGNYSCECDSGFTGDGYNCTGEAHT